ncbi:MAG: hypothetical protein N4J56_000502 [Chroococcidiopsis sp. SAG 2025]|nr:hypothetical protein [Chroococcidiopsis sp. SAG 2025]
MQDSYSLEMEFVFVTSDRVGVMGFIRYFEE